MKYDVFISYSSKNQKIKIETPTNIHKTMAEKKNEVEKDFSQTEKYNSREWVDLALPSGLKWATCNLGATTPEEYGDYFAWGETEPKSGYTADNSATYKKAIGDISGDLRYDAARKNWGNSWRIPTEAEFSELISNCTWTWTTQNNVNGYRVTGVNGNSIFLPAASCCVGSSLSSRGEYGNYWASTPERRDSEDAYCLSFYCSYHLLEWTFRYLGQTVRPVCE